MNPAESREWDAGGTKKTNGTKETRLRAGNGRGKSTSVSRMLLRGLEILSERGQSAHKVTGKRKTSEKSNYNSGPWQFLPASHQARSFASLPQAHSSFSTGRSCPLGALANVVRVVRIVSFSMSAKRFSCCSMQPRALRLRRSAPPREVSRPFPSRVPGPAGSFPTIGKLFSNRWKTRGVPGQSLDIPYGGMVW